MSFLLSKFQKIKDISGLSLSLAKANFKVRNEGSFLGIFWYLLEPLVFFIILLLIRGSISDNQVENYPIYLFLGLIMFNFFNAVTNFSTSVIKNNSGFIKSLKINKESFVFSGVLQFIFSHFFEFIILVVLLLYFNINIFGILLYPVIFLFFCLFTTGLSLILAVVGVYINDLRNVWLVFTRILWFITPIFYIIRDSNSLLQKVSILNPLYYFINISRDIIIFHKIPQLHTIFLGILFSFLVFFVGILIFEKAKNKLAEKI